ncbi:MAG: RHS repeat-associated core domain-containing protein [Pseudomonadota bacterium]|nr:RHS repeat-associated core domain-containing protein [Pseudomonadota bacterium]
MKRHLLRTLSLTLGPALALGTAHAQTAPDQTPASPPAASTPAASSPAATYHVDYQYVPAGQGGAGQMASVTYPSGKVLAYHYDHTGQLTGLSWAGQPLISQITWSPLGVPTAWRWPIISGASTPEGPGLPEKRTYNTAGQLTESGIAHYSWDAAGRISHITQHLFGPPAQAGGPASAFTLSSALDYDEAGRISSLTHSLPPDMASALPAGTRVQDITGPLQASYTWDANGNRQSAHYSQFDGSGNAHSLQRHFSLSPQHNRVLAVQDQWHMTSGSVQSEERQLQWDASARLISDGQLSFAYDPHGRIQHISGLGRHTRYQSNALGQRVRKTQDSGTGQTSLTDTVYGEEEMAPGLSSYPLGHYRPGQSGAQALAEYIWLPTAQGPLPVAAEIDGRLYAIHADHLHTPRRLTDTQGRPVWQWVTTAFGEVEATDATTGFTRERLHTSAPAAAGGTDLKHFTLRYPGQQYDEETGLHYNHHRYYDPYLTVRYTQADPLGLLAGWNRFAYVSGNPINFIDPEGLKGWYCQRPLGKPPGTRGSPIFNHQYLCVTRTDGSVSCGGLTTDGNPLSGEPRLTRPDEDYYDPKSCKEVDDDQDQCFEQCVLRNFSKPNKPRYGIGPLTDCQEYADDLYYGCKILCNMRKGGR